MSEIKPVSSIKTWQERLQGVFYGHDEEIQCRDAETLELRADNEAQAKRIAELESTLEDIADGKPRLMQDQSGYEFFCYQYNPTEKARKALFASKLIAASKNGDSK